jgi:hypothetical protein
VLAVRSCRAGGCFTCEGRVTVSPSGWIVLIAWHSGHSMCAIETPPSDLATAQSRPKTSTRSLALFASTAFRQLDRALEHARRRTFPSSLTQQWKQWKRQASPGAFRSSGHPALARSTNSHHCWWLAVCFVSTWCSPARPSISRRMR